MVARRVLAVIVVTTLLLQVVALAVPADAWRTMVPDVFAANLSGQKSGPATAAPGETISYAIVVTNNDAIATDVRIVDQVPSGLTFNTNGSTSGCVLQGSAVECPALTYAVNQSATFNLAFTVSPTTACDTDIVNIASIQQSGATVAATNQVKTTVTCPKTDVSITKTANPTTITHGQDVTFTIVVRNNSSVTAKNVSIRDPFQGGITFGGATGATCNADSSEVVRCPLGDLAPNAEKTVQLTVHTPAFQGTCSPAQVYNTAFVETDTADSNPLNNQSQITVSLTCPVNNNADVEVVKTAPSTAVRGTNIVYTIVARNKGPGLAKNVVVKDPIPGGLNYVSATGATCSQTSNNTEITCTLGDMTANQEKTLTLTFSIPTIANCSVGQAYNTVYIYTDSTDTSQSNNLSQATTSLTCPSTNTTADLSVVKTGPSSVLNGDLITYTLTATNNGSVTVQNVEIADTFPSQLTYVSGSDPTCHLANANEVECGDGFTIPAGQSKTVQIIFRATQVTPCASSSFDNQAYVVSATNVDPTLANNYSTITTTVTCPSQQTGADMSVIKTANPTSVVRGQNVVFTMVVRNNGPQQATNVVLKDPLQGGLTYVSATGATCTATGVTVNCLLGNMAAGTEKTVQLTALTPGIASCTGNALVYNTAYVYANEADTVAANNQSQITITLTCPTTTGADVSIVKTANPITFTAGQQVSFTLQVQNIGPGVANSVVVTDTLPSGFTFQSASGATCTTNLNVITCQLGTLNPSEQKTITIVANTPVQQACTGYTNIATVSTTSTDSNTANNQSQVTVNCATGTDVSIVKTGPTSIARGTNSTYSVTVTNNGPGTANEVVVRDTVPAGLGFVSAQGASCGISSVSEIVCQLGTLTAGASKTLTFVFSVPTQQPCSQSTIQNTATVQTTPADANPSNNTSTAITTVTCPTGTGPDISVTKSGPSTVQRGSTITYTIVVSNAGPGQAANVVVRDPFNSSDMQYSASSGVNTSCTVSNNQVQCSIGTLNAGESRSITLSFLVPYASNSCGTINNTATVTTDSQDTNTANNQSQTVSTQIQCVTPPPPPPPHYPPHHRPEPPVVIYQTQYQTQTQTMPEARVQGVVFPQTGAFDSFYAPLQNTAAFLRRPAQSPDSGNSTLGFLTLLGLLGIGAAGVATRRFLV